MKGSVKEAMVEFMGQLVLAGCCSPGSIQCSRSGTLASQAITPEAWGALQRGNRLEFLELREKRIAEIVDDFVQRHLA